MSMLLLADQKGIDLEKRLVPAVVNSITVDTYRTIILPEGAVLERFMRNPVCGFMHNRMNMPVARATEIQRDANRMRMLFEFDTDEVSEEVFQKYVRGFMRGFSIYFDWLDVVWGWSSRDKWGTFSTTPTVDELCRTALIDGKADAIIRKWELFSVDCVDVPSNPDCLAERSARSVGGDAFQMQAILDQMRALGKAMTAVGTQFLELKERFTAAAEPAAEQGETADQVDQAEPPAETEDPPAVAIQDEVPPPAETEDTPAEEGEVQLSDQVPPPADDDEFELTEADIEQMSDEELAELAQLLKVAAA